MNLADPFAILRLRDIPCKHVGKFLPVTVSRLPTRCHNKEPQLADKIKLVFDLGYAILLLRIDERKIYPVRVTEVILLRVSTLYPGTKKRSEDLPLVVWPGFGRFRLRFCRVSNFRASVMVFHQHKSARLLQAGART